MGVGALTDCFTGFVTDFHVSNHCTQCTIAENKRKNGKYQEQHYEEWKNHHKGCDKTFEGDSTTMETEAANVLWRRSVESFGLRYIVIVGDGDSSAYKSVTFMNTGCGPYGSEKPFEKQECINHVSKRFGTWLRKLRSDMWIEKANEA